MLGKRVFLLTALTLLTSTLIAQEEGAVYDEFTHINALPIVPKSKAKGLTPFEETASIHESNSSEILEQLELSAKGNSDVAMMAGVNASLIKTSHGHQLGERPKIGLVLSGGGARGGAHLGVIKVFEDHNIPIDAIVGTSMGSFIGGLYAAGMSSSEIERELTTMDWRKVITFDYERKEIPYRRKKLQRDFPGNAKVGINSDNEIVFGTGLFKRQNMLTYLKKKTYNVSNLKDFDELRIPFRSVASRLRDGDTVVLRDGSLAEAIYASIAIPGGFDPITINGEVLVDGGVADNLPLDVMRKEMGMDYIVVVDISTPYDKDAKFDNYIAVLGQLSNILMRKNVEQTIESMKGHDNEILLTPDLKGYTPLDADKYPEIIAIGEETAEKSYDQNLSHLSLYEDDYYHYLANRPKIKRKAAPVIDSIELDNGTYLSDTAILGRLHVELGKPIDREQLDKDIAEIYNLMVFDDVTYLVVNKNGKNILKVTTTPSWDMNGQIKFALGFEDNFDGHTDYFIKLEYIKFGLNSYGGEWRNRISFGMENLLLTELYQPIDPYGHVFVFGRGLYRNKKVYVSPSILQNHEIKADLDETFVMQARDYGGVAGIGVNLMKNLRLEAGADIRHVNPSTYFIITDGNNSAYTTVSSDANVYDYIGELEYDSLNNAFFPEHGQRAKVEYRYSKQISGGKLSYNQFLFDYAGAFSVGHHTFMPSLKFAQTFSVNDYGQLGSNNQPAGFSLSQDFNSYFTLGGLFKLSGLPTNAITGNNVSFASFVYRYRLTQKDFFGSLSMPLYAGVSFESGATWYGVDNFDADRLISANSIFFAADTIIGPFYLGVGRAVDSNKEDYYSTYISLGQSF